ncbi:MAG: hypothetical protein PHE84_15115 [bacterium]|nr:hypothetical protein [bacterium]
MKNHLDRISRLFLSFMILAGIVWFGVTFTPATRVGRATVTDRMTGSRPALKSIPGTSWEGVREFRVNGGRMLIERGKAEKINSSDLWSSLQRNSGDVIAGGEKQGFLAGLPLGRGQALKLLSRGFNPADLVSAFLVLPRPGSGADLFAFSASGLGLANFLAEGLNDSPGVDPAGFPRLPLSQRLVSIQGSGSSPRLQIAVYRYPGSVESARRFYAGRLAGEGWESRGGPEAENFLNLGKANARLSLRIDRDPEEGVLITAAMITK